MPAEHDQHRDGSSDRSPGQSLAYWLSLVVLVVIGFVVGWHVNAGLGEGELKLGDLGTWVGGVGATLAVVVAVWQTLRANKQARAAELRSDRDIADRRSADLRAREYGAVSSIMRALGVVYAETKSTRNYADKVEDYTTEGEETPWAHGMSKSATKNASGS